MDSPTETGLSMRAFRERCSAIVTDEHVEHAQRILIECIVWAYKREQNQTERYSYQKVRNPALFAKFIHNAFCLVDSHSGSGTLTRLQSRYEECTGFRFARHAHQNGHTTPGDTPKMDTETPRHVHALYPTICALLFPEPGAAAAVLAVLLERYKNEVLLDTSST